MLQGIAELLLDQWAGWEVLPALLCGETGRQLSYGELGQLARGWGAGLLGAGLGPGHRVAVILPNCPEYGALLVGTVGVGATLVPVSPALSNIELGRLLEVAQTALARMISIYTALLRLPGLRWW